MGIIHTTVIVEEIDEVTKRCCLPDLPPPGVYCCIHTPPPPTLNPPLPRHLHPLATPPPPPCTLFAAAPPPPATAGADTTPTIVTLATTTAPTRILGLRYRDTGNIVPIVDSKGLYVPANTKGAIWIPSLKKWVGGPECEFS